jgi:hypothetical protein
LKGAVPPAITTVAEPSAAIQLAATVVIVDPRLPEPVVTVAAELPTQPLASVTVTVYEAAARPEAVAVVCPFDQR